MENETKLLPCPFCGGKADLRETENDIGGKLFYIECSGCDLTVKNDYLPKGLVRKWNTRKPIERIVKKLEKAFPINPYPNEFTNGRDLGIKKAIEIVENELN